MTLADVAAPSSSRLSTLQEEPSVPDSQDMTAGLDALSTLARSPQYRKVIRFLVDNPNSYKGQIQEGTGLPPSSLGRHLSELEDRRVITGDVSGADRRGYAVRYTVDVAYVDQLVTQLRTELLG